MRLFKVMNTGLMERREARRRVWLEPGRRVMIAPRLTLLVLFDRIDGDHLAYALIEGPGLSHCYALPVSSYLDVSAWAGLLAIPRALEVDPVGRPQRLLMEFQSVRPDIRFAV